MRIGFGDFVDGSFALPEQPAGIGYRGFGDLTPGSFAVPQTPVGLAGRRGMADFVIGAFAVPQNPVVPGIGDGLGDMVPTAPMYPITPNTVIANESDIAYAQGLTGFGGGCGGGCGCSKCGMGDISADFSKIAADIEAGNYSAAFSDPVAGFPLWGWVSGAAVIYLFFFSGGEHSRVSRGRRAARSGFQSARSAYA